MTARSMIYLCDNLHERARAGIVVSSLSHSPSLKSMFDLSKFFPISVQFPFLDQVPGMIIVGMDARKLNVEKLRFSLITRNVIVEEYKFTCNAKK